VAKARSWLEIQQVTKEYLVAQSRMRAEHHKRGGAMRRTGVTGLLAAMQVEPDGLGLL